MAPHPHLSLCTGPAPPLSPSAHCHHPQSLHACIARPLTCAQLAHPHTRTPPRRAHWPNDTADPELVSVIRLASSVSPLVCPPGLRCFHSTAGCVCAPDTMARRPVPAADPSLPPWQFGGPFVAATPQVTSLVRPAHHCGQPGPSMVQLNAMQLCSYAVIQRG